VTAHQAPERIAIPEPVLGILRRLEEAGYETWCVGGAIRDALLGDPQADVDLATAAPPDVVRKLFRRTIPVGLAHGTVGVLDDDQVLHEVTTFRRDVRTDGRHAEVEFGVSLDDDLARRDFTINAIAYHPLRHEWRDPFGGRDDLARGIVRAVGDPAARFREDRLRILRALRFAARFNLAIEPHTWEAARHQVPDTALLSAERVREEWWKAVASARDPRAVVRWWHDAGVDAVWFAGTEARDLAPDLGDAVLRDPVLLLAAWRVPVAPVLMRLKASGADIARARGIDRGPAAPASAEAVAVRRWMASVGGAADDLAALAARAPWVNVLRQVRERGEATSRSELALSGDDLIAAGVVSPGPELGATLSHLLAAVLEDPSLNDRERLLALARDRRTP
jgi:tRNA nucleotidyltransferase (CCA-adding enzyme)